MYSGYWNLLLNIGNMTIHHNIVNILNILIIFVNLSMEFNVPMWVAMLKCPIQIKIILYLSVINNH